ncbi:hypothetical protein M8J76_002826 [Diaphorina citri]|nr:hypothetical protein M8J76_002826 [Diaphorina citri]
MEHSSSDSLDALSVSAFSKGLTTNDLTNDSQGTYCELGEQSQQLGSQDIFDSQASSISALEYSNGNNSCRQSGKDFSTITTSSTPLTKRKRDTVKEEDGHSSSSDFENLRRTKIKSSDKVQEAKEKSNEDRLSGESGGSQGKNNTIFISSASGENSQLNFSQLDTQLKLLTDIDDLGGGEAGEPVVMSSNGLNHTELHNMSTNSYNSHQIRATAQNENWGNKKVITKTYSANVTIKEVRSETTNQVLSLHISELALCNESPNFSPLVNKIGGRDSLSSGSVYSVGPFPLKGQTHEQRMSCVSSSSSSTLASSAATLAFRNQHKLVQKDGPPVQCINCNYKFKQPVPPPPTVSTPDLVSSGPENISSSVCEDETAPAPSSTPPEEVNTANQTISPSDDTKKFKSPPRHPTATDPPPVPPIPILQATRRSSFTKKFTTLEQIKEEAKPTPVKSSTLTPKKKGRPRKKPAPEVVPPEEIEEPVSEKIKVKEIDESVPEKKKVAKNKRKLELTDSKKKKMDQNEEDQQSKGERKAGGQKGGGGNKGRRSVDGGERGVESSKAGKKEKKELISGPDHLQGGRLEENTPPNVMAANVYDPGKTVLAIWTDKIYYPAVIEEDLQSFLRVRYLDGFVKKIIKQQTVPMSVLYEDTPVHRVCTVEWTEESSLATVNFECLRMFPEHVRVIQNKYTSVLESPKLHQLTLDNILQRKRTPARRHDGHSE